MTSRLFVGNLPYTCTEDDIRDLFEPRFTVLSVRIVADRETGRPRGFAFVELENDDAARAAIDALEGQALGGRSVSVREARERAKPARPAPTVDVVTRRRRA